MQMQTGTYPSPNHNKWSLSKFESVDLGLQPPAMKISKTNVNLEPTGPPERTFRVVMAGDASVGKSSFIMRLCRGEFIPNLPSTLGVDFHVRTLNVDGKNVAIQVWDTAGQERFRSLCRSYFRRADGAVMMYDCTCEQSFLNVRNWMETIQARF